MYEEAMRNMRDAFYDPNLHGVDWKSVTDRYRPLVYKISSKSELRDILSQAFGELSALHVFVQVKAEDPVLPLGTPSACLGADFQNGSGGVEDFVHLRQLGYFGRSELSVKPNHQQFARAFASRGRHHED